MLLHAACCWMIHAAACCMLLHDTCCCMLHATLQQRRQRASGCRCGGSDSSRSPGLLSHDTRGLLPCHHHHTTTTTCSPPPLRDGPVSKTRHDPAQYSRHGPARRVRRRLTRRRRQPRPRAAAAPARGTLARVQQPRPRAAASTPRPCPFVNSGPFLLQEKSNFLNTDHEWLNILPQGSCMVVHLSQVRGLRAFGNTRKRQRSQGRDCGSRA